jgi:hypothetical protein
LSNSTNGQQNDGLYPETGLPCYQGVTELVDEHANEDDSDQGKDTAFVGVMANEKIVPPDEQRENEEKGPVDS